MRRVVFTAVAVALAGVAQSEAPPNSQPNSYRTVEHWYRLPEGRTMGSSSSVAVAANGHVWVVDRCGVNSCTGSALDPVLEFDAAGKLLRASGAGAFVFPHSLTFDAEGNYWITD